jgi:hypothetical protein
LRRSLSIPGATVRRPLTDLAGKSTVLLETAQEIVALRELALSRIAVPECDLQSQSAQID